MGCFQALEVLKIASGQVCILLTPPIAHSTFFGHFVALHQDYLLSHLDASTETC